jgi:hypothetical protein
MRAPVPWAYKSLLWKISLLPGEALSLCTLMFNTQVPQVKPMWTHISDTKDTAILGYSASWALELWFLYTHALGTVSSIALLIFMFQTLEPLLQQVSLCPGL